MDPTSIGLLVAEGSALAAIAAAYSLGRPQSKDSISTPAPVVQTVGNTPVSSVVQTVGNTPVSSVVQTVPTATPALPATVPSATAAPPSATAAPPSATAAPPSATAAPPSATAAPPTATAAPPVSRTLTPELEQAITTVFRTQKTNDPTIEPANLARRLFIGDSVKRRQFILAFHSDKCVPSSIIQLNNEYSKTLCDFMFTSGEQTVDGNFKLKDLENTRSEFIKIVRTITAASATPTTATPALLDTVAEPTTAQASSPINAPGFDESISFPEPEQTLNLASTPTDTLEIPPELQSKLNAAREKFETLRLKVETEEDNPKSPFAKSTRKQTRSEAARKAAVTREKNKVNAALNAENEKTALDFKRKTANEARDERARKRAGIVSDPTSVESILENTEASTNEVAESLKALEKQQPASASQNWFMDVENELQMYFDYYNQVERDLADVPPPKTANVLKYADLAIKEAKERSERARKKQEEASNRLETIKNNPIGGRRRTPKKHKKTKTRKLTFRRTRKH